MKKGRFTLPGRITVLIVVLLAACCCAANAQSFVDDFDSGYQSWLKWDGVDTYLVDNNPGVIRLAANTPNAEARITSHEKFTYGIYEMRFKTTNQAGSYLYFGWFSRDPWSNPTVCDRVDGNLMLAVPGNWDAAASSPYLTPDVWHTVRLIWQPGSVESIYDGVSLGTVTQNVPSEAMPLIIDVLNGGGTTGASVFEADYVRVTPLPEPSSLAALAAMTGMLGMVIRRRKR